MNFLAFLQIWPPILDYTFIAQWPFFAIYAVVPFGFFFAILVTYFWKCLLPLWWGPIFVNFDDVLQCSALNNFLKLFIFLNLQNRLTHKFRKSGSFGGFLPFWLMFVTFCIIFMIYLSSANFSKLRPWIMILDKIWCFCHFGWFLALFGN